MKNKDNYTLVSKSNGYTVLIKRANGETTKYTTKPKEQYVVPFTFNAFHRKEKLINSGIKETAGIILQACHYMNLTTKESYKSISGFKPSNI